MPTYKKLSQKHPEWDGPYWRRCRALYAGGKKLLKDPAVLQDVFPPHLNEQPYVYAERCKRAYYIPYAGEVIDMIKNGFFSPEDRTLFHDLVNGLLTSDPYMVLADYRSYQEVRLKALNAYRDPNHWQQMAIRNVAGSGPFSSDRTIREYARDIWKIDPVPVDVPVYSPE